MHLQYWLLIFLIALIVIAIIFYFIYKSYDKSRTGNAPNSNEFIISTLYDWGPNTPSGNTFKNVCQVYTFPSIVGPSGQFGPGQPTLDTNILNNLSGNVNTTCTDIDQIAAQQVIRTCAPNVINNAGTSLTVCYRSDGTVAAPGETELLYSGASCSIPTCNGDLGVLSIPFQPPQFSCVSDTTGIESPPVPCNPASSTQLFRALRYSTGPNGLELDENGYYYQFQQRATGLCLNVSGTTISTEQSVILSPCGESPNWLQLPEIVILGTTGTTGQPGQFTAYQQTFGYVGNLGTLPVPSFATDQAQFDFVMGNTIGVMTADPNFRVHSYDAGLTFRQSAVFLDYALYNLIVNPPV